MKKVKAKIENLLSFLFPVGQGVAKEERVKFRQTQCATKEKLT